MRKSEFRFEHIVSPLPAVCVVHLSYRQIIATMYAGSQLCVYWGTIPVQYEGIEKRLNPLINQHLCFDPPETSNPVTRTGRPQLSSPTAWTLMDFFGLSCT